MVAIVLKGSTATYVGKQKGWGHRRNKKMVLVNDTKTSAEQYSFLIDGEEKPVFVNYESINWISRERQTIEDNVIQKLSFA